jgi:hypothetical protein
MMNRNIFRVFYESARYIEVWMTSEIVYNETKLHLPAKNATQ